MKHSKVARITLFAFPVALAITLLSVSPAEAAFRAAVFCEAVSSNGGVCEAFPQNNIPGGSGDLNFTYRWSTSGSAILPTPSPATSPGRQVACVPILQEIGHVRVVVIAPDGQESQAFAIVCVPPRDDRPIRSPF